MISSLNRRSSGFAIRKQYPKDLQSEIFHTPINSEQKLSYIHNDPVKAGIVDNPEEYRYSSARDYCGQKGLLNIEKIE